MALAFRRLALAVADRLPAPGRRGKTGLVLMALLALGAVAGVLALSRADWRVLDLGPLQALGVAAVLGVAHGLFWHRRRPGPPAAGGRAR